MLVVPQYRERVHREDVVRRRLTAPVKYTVPPVTLAPLGAVGWVSPGPLVGTDDDEPVLVPALLPVLALLLLLLEPQAAANSTTSATPNVASAPRVILRIK